MYACSKRCATLEDHSFPTVEKHRLQSDEIEKETASVRVETAIFSHFIDKSGAFIG